jgi:hypothetical protein
VEVELEGAPQIVIGIHQAIKYKSLAEAEHSFPLMTSRVRAHRVAYRTDYADTVSLARRYNVNLVNVDCHLVLAASGSSASD